MKNIDEILDEIREAAFKLEANKGNKAFMPYWYNLLEIYNFVKEKNK